MSDWQENKMSRRMVLKRTALLAAGVVAVPVLLTSQEALAAPAAKSSWRTAADMNTVQYRPQPNGSKECAHCTQFVPGNNGAGNGYCAVVDATITPHGWCNCFSTNS